MPKKGKKTHSRKNRAKVYRRRVTRKKASPRRKSYTRVVVRKRRISPVAYKRRSPVSHVSKRRSAARKIAPVTINMPAMPVSPQNQEPGVNKILIENFVALQRVLTNLSTKMDDLTTQISKLLDIFEISAKALAEKDFDTGGDKKELVNRLDSLLDQNRTLARGMALMHERIPREQQQQPLQQFYSVMPQSSPPQSYFIDNSNPSFTRPMTREVTPEPSVNALPPPPSPMLHRSAGGFEYYDRAECFQ